MCDNGVKRISDENLGVCLLRLNNHLRVQYKKTSFETKQCRMKLYARGGRALETDSTIGASYVGMRTLIDGGAGDFSSEELQGYCNFHGLTIDVHNHFHIFHTIFSYRFQSEPKPSVSTSLFPCLTKA